MPSLRPCAGWTAGANSYQSSTATFEKRRAAMRGSRNVLIKVCSGCPSAFRTGKASILDYPTIVCCGFPGVSLSSRKDFDPRARRRLYNTPRAFIDRPGLLAATWGCGSDVTKLVHTFSAGRLLHYQLEIPNAVYLRPGPAVNHSNESSYRSE